MGLGVRSHFAREQPILARTAVSLSEAYRVLSPRTIPWSAVSLIPRCRASASIPSNIFLFITALRIERGCALSAPSRCFAGAPVLSARRSICELLFDELDFADDLLTFERGG